MRESSPESPAGAPRPTPQRRWRPVATPLSTLSSESSRRTSSPIAAISRCTADDDHRMTSCSQPAPSNPSSSATFSPYSDESSSSRRREQRIPDPSPTSASHSTSYHLRTIFANLRWSLLLAVLVFLLLASCECSARPQDDDLDSQAYSEYRVDPPTDLSRNQTAFFQLASRTSFNMLQGERVVEPPLDSQERRKEKWLERHKHRKNKNDRRGRKRLKGEQKESFILTRNELPKMKDNCVGVKITQRVRMAGCLTRVVHNRYCHGTCTSVFIPRLRAKKLKATFESCSACLPYDYDRVQIRLECPDRDPPTIVRRVIKVKSCTCQSQCQLSNV